jgi:phosphohistidine phosphatase
MAEVELILLRHGLAQPHGSVEDRQRALTPEGRLRTRRVCQRARQFGLQAPLLITSHLVRAYQTAEVAVEEGLAPSLTSSEALAPGGDPWPLLQDWWTRTAAGGSTRLILVGHEPDLGHLACRLIGAPAGALAFKKAGIALLAWPRGTAPPSSTNPAQLRLLLTPKVLAST